MLHFPEMSLQFPHSAEVSFVSAISRSQEVLVKHGFHCGAYLICTPSEDVRFQAHERRAPNGYLTFFGHFLHKVQVTFTKTLSGRSIADMSLSFQAAQ